MHLRIASLLLALSLASLLRPTPASAQTINDIARLSETSSTGTARSLGMAGAYTAVGGDFTSATVNPGGLGLYRSSELQISPTLQIATSKADMHQTSGQTATRTNFAIPSLSLVLTKNLDNEDGLQAFTFAAGFNQLTSYQRRTEVTTPNNTNSISQHFAGRADGVTADQFEESQLPLAPGDLSGQAYYTFIPYENSSFGMINLAPAAAADWEGAFQYGNINQTLEQVEKGRHNEWAVSLAGNFEDKFYVGATFNIADIRYEHRRTIVEQEQGNFYTDFDNALPDTGDITSLQYTDQYTTSGSGVGATFGFLFQPIDLIRLGVSIRSPQALFLTDEFSNSMQITDDFGNTGSNESAEGEFEYQVTTPYEVRGGLMILLPNKIGLVSLGGGFSDYRNASVSDRGNTNANFTGLNRNISDFFATTYDLRIGTELRYESFYGRAGFAYFQSYFSQDGETYTPVGGGGTNTADLNRLVYSGGLGYRGSGGLILDFALSFHQRTDLLGLYGTSDGNGPGPTAVPTSTLANAMMTIGYQFGK